jgi:hypothetical protein
MNGFLQFTMDAGLIILALIFWFLVIGITASGLYGLYWLLFRNEKK